MEYTVYYEIAVGESEPVKDTMIVEAVNSERAKEFALHRIEEEYNDKGNAFLLACEVQF